MGRDRPHVRSRHPEAYCLNVDIAGPFVPGHDQLESAPRYFAVGVFTVPVRNGCPLAQKLQEMGGFVESPGDLQEELQREQDLLRQLSVQRGGDHGEGERRPEERGRDGPGSGEQQPEERGSEEPDLGEGHPDPEDPDYLRQ